MSKPNIYDLDFAKRMEYLMKQYGGSTSSLASKLEVSPPTITRWIKGEADPTRSNLIKIAQITNVNLEWLALGIGEQNKDAKTKEITQPEQDLNNEFALVKDFSDVQVSAGFGAYNSDYQLTKYIKVEKSWLDSRGLKAANCVAFRVIGDSMQPTLEDGEKIIVDTSKKELTEGKIFIINHKGTMWVKKVHINFNGLDLISDNPTYSPIKLTEEEANSLNVIGQLVRGYKNF